MTRFPRRLALVLLAGLSLALVACASEGKSPGKQRDVLLRSYASAIRWSDFDTAWGYVDPKVREEAPLTDLEHERFKMIQVTGYEVRNQVPVNDNEFEQVVDIRLITRATQVERAIVDHQRWVYDVEAKRWWLASGLPDITPH